MNDEYRLTSSEYAKILGISCEALRSRRRRQIETNYIRDDYGNYWWKNDRPNGGAVNENDHPKKNGLFRDPGAKKIDTRKRRRGVHESGSETNYHNAKNGWQLEELNLMRKYAKLDKDLAKTDISKDDVEEFLKVAKENKRKKIEKKLKESQEELEELPGQPISMHGVNQNDPKYGKMLDGVDWAQTEKQERLRSEARYRRETDTKFVEKEQTDMFGFKQKYKIPDFRDYYSGPYRYRNPYGDGMFDSNDDGSVEINLGRQSSLPKNQFGYSKPRNFRNKIEEGIWDAEQKLKNKKY